MHLADHHWMALSQSIAATTTIVATEQQEGQLWQYAERIVDACAT